MDLTDFVELFGRSPKLTMFVIAPTLALIAVLLWHASGNCAERVCNCGSKTFTFWKYVILGFLSLIGLIVAALTVMFGCAKAFSGMGGDTFVLYLIGLGLFTIVVGNVPRTIMKQARK